ncbi:DUF2141 domain-containing protein [Bowmanella dokdonensis]|uniref:DUF2141 domain-containing protein n=1 Tax=Bowmanella dokdonensis TaxID=751969 RepID=A0A939DKE4_9ALTE|nr:DUF2141 domain-containing protein [Bowmanella dokdonensis]MBN7823932.1 DUF2141 domain-containing protein [Bowmanella dokdonensis]
MKRTVSSVMVLSALLIPVIANGASVGSTTNSETSSLKIVVDGIRNSEGNVSVTLCMKGEAFPSGCSISAKGKAEQGRSKVIFDDLKNGEYAAALFHDENADGKLTFIQEGIAFSNNSNLEMGPPKFDPAKFTVKGETEIQVDIRYFN